MYKSHPHNNICCSQDESEFTSEDDYSEREQANIAVLEYLLASGARVNNKDFYGLTALHHAALRGNAAVARILIEREEIMLEVRDLKLIKS